MSRSNISVVTDNKTFVFKPIAGPNPMISQYVDTTPGAAVLFDRLGIEIRPSAAGNDGTRIVHRINVPLAAEIGESNAQGYVSTPKSLGENKLVLNLSISKYSSAEDTAEFADLVQAYVALPEFRSMLIEQLTPQ